MPGRRTEDEAVDEPLLRPTAAYEASGEMIEQLGMSWNLATDAEVIDTAHDALAKELLPDAVHDDTRGQWVARVGQPVGELHASALIGRDR